MQEREIVRARVVENRQSGKPRYGIRVEYDDGTSQEVSIGSREAAQKATNEAVEIGEAYILELMQDAE